MFRQVNRITYLPKKPTVRRGSRKLNAVCPMSVWPVMHVLLTAQMQPSTYKRVARILRYSIDNSLCSFESSAFALPHSPSVPAIMLFARVAPFFFAALTFGLVVSANPVPDAETRTDSVETIVNNLQRTVGSITSQLRKTIQ